MRTNNFIHNLCIILFISSLSGCLKYPAYEVTNPPFVNQTSLEMYVGEQREVVSSPVSANFKWTSKNVTVATVSQTGIVKAIGEGATTIIVESDNDQKTIDVRVRVFVPTTDITLPKELVRLFEGDKVQVWAYPVPDDASESIVWTSANSSVATINKSGVVTAQALGITTVTASSGDITKTIEINISELYKCDKTEWTVEVSDETASDGGGKDRMIDGNTDNAGYWHSQWSPSNTPLPHWAVIDMKEPIEAGRIITQRRSNGDTKTLQYFIGNDPDPDAGTWTKIAEGAYASTTSAHSITLDVAEPVSGRYLKLVLPDSNRVPFTAICEIDVFGLRN
ncbi:hypothetical protein EZS27_009537 [termite gut metagenome]|uniref:F5/8 type C domain-containing protein n=1 Tax=termite gut metagenome TaxID=433724 RepID=A0A5J4S9B7_9ZZZZ